MNTNENRSIDVLKPLFQRLPEEDLPSSFRENMMKKIMEEAVRTKKRNERLGLLAVILASVVVLALAVFVFIYMEIPQLEISLPKLTSISFYLYIGALSLLLLFGDYIMRKAYREKYKKYR